MTGTNFYKLSLMLQFKFFCEKLSVLEANTAIYSTPDFRADSIPLEFGTKQGYETPYFLVIFVYNSSELAICGIHFGETKEPTYTD